tara:strand:- start:1601 stop:2455 length:855 start_codon:yes stop_codon:yes gene_type:complete
LLNKIRNFLLKKNPIIFIDSESELDEALRKLSLEKLIAIDTEFDWRNTYYPKLSLMQISTNRKIFLIDCLKVNSLSKLNFIFENKGIIKIFHAIRSDVTVLTCSTNLKFTNCFDVQIAERCLSNEQSKSYAKLVLKYLKLRIDKSETNSNWLKRPFTKRQINYAANDVRFLIRIYKKQKRILEDEGSLLNVKKLTNKEVSLGSQELHIPRLKKLKFNRKIEKDLFMWRENTAMIKNIPPSFIFKDKYFKKILKIYDDGSLRSNAHNILKNEWLTDDLIRTLEKC